MIIKQYIASQLPYWEQQVELNIGFWQPYKIDYLPVSSNRLFGEQVLRIAQLAFEMEGELLVLRSSLSGYSGTLAREKWAHVMPNIGAREGFSAIFSYSYALETALKKMVREERALKIGLSLCAVWSELVLLDECKVIVLASVAPLQNEEELLTRLELSLQRELLPPTKHTLSFFAEKFGYKRFSIPFETENVTLLKISSLLLDFELQETLEILGEAEEEVQLLRVDPDSELFEEDEDLLQGEQNG